MIPSRLAKWLLAIYGWKLQGNVPDIEKFILIAAPHTANRDVLIMLLVAGAFNIRLRWLGKQETFRWPIFGWIMKQLGGIPVNRQERNNVVSTMAEHIKAAKGRFVLAISPEGTRKKTSKWKTGFYYIALQAEVPIVCGFIDFKAGTTGVGPTIMPTGNIEADMAEIRAFYAPMEGKYHEKFSDMEVKNK